MVSTGKEWPQVRVKKDPPSKPLGDDGESLRNISGSEEDHTERKPSGSDNRYFRITSLKLLANPLSSMVLTI